MPAGAALPAAGVPARHLVLDVDGLRHAILWLMIFGGSVVMIQPSPYEIFGIAAMFVWAVTGLRFRREMVPITILLVVYMCGASLTLIQILHKPGTALWTAIGWFMAMTAVFFMMLTAEDSRRRMETILNAFVATAVMASAIGIAAYFRVLPGSDSFMLYSRAKSTFADPNVFGPFLVLPGVYLMQKIYLGGLRRSLGASLALLIILAGLFLSFSRGAWGHFVASAALMTVMMLWCARRAPALRERIVLMCVGGFVVAVLLIVVLLAIPSVRDLFLQRASLDQSYDVGKFGRFNRHWMGFALALEKPFGIGIFEFAPLFGEDTHNSYLNAFMSYGWLGGVTWPAIVVLTLVVGWRNCLRPSPWRHQFICVMATFQVVVLEAWIIDVDHWRHVWLLFGAVWGLGIATTRLERAAAREHGLDPRLVPA